MNPVVPLVLLMLLALSLGNEQEDKIEVKVYYEALCIFSRKFFSTQLQPSMISKGRLQYTDLKLIPYGNVRKHVNPITGELEFNCQHGRRECELNALHVCIIENTDIWDAFNVIACLMVLHQTEFDECAERFDVNAQAIEDCLATRTIKEILVAYGRQTELGTDIHVTGVPAVEFDYEFDKDEQDEARENFDEIFCEKFGDKFHYYLAGC